jgi:hypothetical protein
MKRRSVFQAILLAFAVVSVLAIVGCTKDDDNNSVYQSSARDQAAADNLFSDVMNQVDLAARQLEDELPVAGQMKYSLDGGCATITITPWDTITWPKTITVDFGETNCEGADGRYRRGIIQATITGHYLDSLTEVTITPMSYYVNDYKVDGLKTLKNLGHVTNGKMTFSIRVEYGTITDPEGGQFFWESDRIRVWTQGEETAWPAVMDDVFEISGESSGTTRSGINFLIQSTQPLRIERTCEWIVSGELEITPEGYSTRILNYGDGTCDDKAIVTVNGNTYNITLP